MTTEELVKLLERAAIAFDGMANIMDAWADESRRGGWSTHQVEANRQQANNARRYAAQIRRAITGES